MRKNLRGVSLAKSVAVILLLLAVWMLPQNVRAGVLDKYSDSKVYDVTVLGADKTGKKSSDSAVQEALRTAQSDLRRGNMDGKKNALIYFPRGNYKISTSIRLYTDMMIAAETGTKVTKSGSTNVIQMYYAENCSVEGGTWIGSGEGAILYATGCKNLAVRTVNLQNGKTGCTLFSTTASLNRVTITKCNSMGLNVSNGSAVKASGCKTNSNGSKYPAKGFLGHGIGVYGGSALTLTDSQTVSNKTNGVSLQEGKLTADNVLIRDNGYVGVGTAKVCTVTMKNCDIYHNGYKVKGNDNGVSIVAGSTGTFTGCKFRNNEVTGLLATGNSKITAKSCTFKGNGAHNIYVENLGAGKAVCRIDSCTFYKCAHGSVEVHVKKKTAYSLKATGKNKYYQKPNYRYWLNDKIFYQK